MARTFVISNQKGGVGKTTTCVNLGASLAARGLRVLLLDLDPRSDLSHYFRDATEGASGALQLLLSPAEFDRDAISTAGQENLWLLPGSLDMAALEFILAQEPERRPTMVRRAVETLGPDFDVVLADTAPGLQLLGLSALAAADRVIVPQQCSFLALHGLRSINEIIERLQEQAGVQVSVAGILLTMLDRRTVHHRQVVDMVRGGFGRLVFETVIPSTIRLQEAAVARVPLLAYEPDHPAAIAYHRLAEEVMSRA
jgi:chromosome partitioning protein